MSRNELTAEQLKSMSAGDVILVSFKLIRRKAVQVRGMRNCEPDPEVRKFVNRFEKQALQAA